ncbi:calcium/sodium antiporter [Candidatus Jorgensenbacteria bacterium]|nr:calcium/sodium antiporter [Candidatus Jorgensenbacteria bacterium]
MTSALFLIILGFVVLLKGADWLVEGSSTIARRLGISQLVIGLTVVAFGTSAPELFVNIFAGIKGEADIAIGNILGSNIVNILLILGIAATIYPLALKRSTIWKEIPLSGLAAIVLALLVNDNRTNGSFIGLTRVDGLVLIAFFFFFLYYTYHINKNDVSQKSAVHINPHSWPYALLLTAIGLISLLIGGKLIVDNAVAIALILKASQAVIGLTIVAIGTSLPELATSAVAAYKKNPDIAVGNIVGSNIFNIFWILGISAVINPLAFSQKLFPDIGVIIFTTLLLFLCMFIGKRHVLERWQGITFVLLYIIYIFSLLVR